MNSPTPYEQHLSDQERCNSADKKRSCGLPWVEDVLSKQELRQPKESPLKEWWKKEQELKSQMGVHAHEEKI